MMKKTDKQTLDMLRGEFAKSTETAKVPLRLQKDSVVAMLKNSDTKTKDFSSKTGNKRNNVVILRRIATAAAVFIVVIVAAIYINQGDIKDIKTDSFKTGFNQNGTVVKHATNFADIVEIVQGLRNGNATHGTTPETDAANTLVPTSPEDRPILGGYEEFVVQETPASENAGPVTDVSSDPNPGNNPNDSDNADIIKISGEYIYIVTTENGADDTFVEQINIVKADPAEEMQVVRSIILSDSSKSENTDDCIEIYLKDNTLIALMERETRQSNTNGNYNKKSVVAITYDVSDPANPVNVREHIQEGEYISSGLYGNDLRIITKKAIPASSENTELDEGNVIPAFEVNGVKTELTPNEIFIAVNNPVASFIFVTVTDITTPDAQPGRLAILGGGTAVYNLQNAIILARGFVSVETDENGDYSSLTEICRFNISSESISFVDSYITDGAFANGTAVDEHNGYLRVVTRKSGTHNLYVFNSKMEFASYTTNIIANKETDRVKFIGDKAYFISEAENGEEICVVDISDPTNPKVGTNLPTDGFLQMLSPVSEDVVLVITEYPVRGSSSESTNGKFFLCDVSDVKNPVILDCYNLSAGYSYPMGANQRQVLLDTEKMIFASPVRYADVSNGEVSSLYLVFDISGNKLNLIGSYNHNSEDGMTADRCVIIGDTFYTVSIASVMAYSAEDQTVISSVAIS